MSLTLRRGLVFFNVLLLILSVIALGNQPEFKAKGQQVRTGFGNGAGDSGQSSVTPTAEAPLPIPGGPPVEERPGSSAPAPLPPNVEVKSGGKPPAVSPPKPGTYRYRMTVKRTSGGQQSEESREMNVKIETVGGSDGETRQIYTMGAGAESSFKYEVSWRSGEVVHLRWFSEGENGFNCDWQPDLLSGKLPIEKGLKWESKSSCEQTMDAFAIRLDYEGVFTVIDSVSGELEGTSFAGWRIDGNYTIKSTSGAGSGQQNRVNTEIFSPAHGLTVRSVSKTHTTSEGNSYEGEETMELLSFRPA